MWNKVEEKLPDKEGKYLTWHKACFGYGYGYYSVDSFNKLEKKLAFYNYDDEYGYYETFPTYWTELPEPPKE